MIRLAVERGIDEVTYLRRTPYRIVQLHLISWLRDKLMPVAAAFGSSSESQAQTSSDDDIEIDDEIRDHVSKGLIPPPPMVSDTRGKGARLPAWFERTSAKRYVVGGVEDKIDRIRLMQWMMSGGKGCFQPKGTPKPAAGRELDMYSAVKKIGSAVSGTDLSAIFAGGRSR